MIYAFKCEECAEQFDVRASVAEMDEGLHPECPSCGSPKVVQDFTNVGMMFRSPQGGGPLCGPGTGAGCC
jgi:putative FmdB family regulatory protein